MSKERDAIMRDIAALEAQLDGKRPARRARRKSSGDNILAALGQLEAMVKEACGESFMDDQSSMSYMDEPGMSCMEESYMDDVDTEEILEALPDEEVPGEDMEEEDESSMTYMQDVFGSDAEDGAEDEITQDSLDDVLETEKSPSSIVTDPSMLDAAPTEYVARMKSASQRLDRVAAYCEQQGRTKLAFRIDQIADAIDARIKKMEARDA